MKKLLILLLLCAPCFASNVTFSFSYDFTVDVNCSATVTTNCVDHFEMFDVTGGARTLILTIQNPANISSTAPTTVSGSFGMKPPYGSRTINVIAVAKDSAGARVESSPAAATFSVKPAAPASLVATSN